MALLPAPASLGALLALAAVCAWRAPAPAARPPAPAYDWPGTYVLTGHGFEEGEREAVLTVTRRDTTHALALAGPPGTLVSFRLVGDSAHVLWTLDDGGHFMAVDLRGRGDSVTGRWAVGTTEGAITGYRRR